MLSGVALIAIGVTAAITITRVVPGQFPARPPMAPKSASAVRTPQRGRGLGS